MAQVMQGIVTQVTDDGRAVIRPFGSGQSLTPPLPSQIIDTVLEGTEYSFRHPIVAVGDSVAYVLFTDGRGVVLAKT